MRIAVESVLAANFVINFLLLICALRPVCLLRPLRISVAAALGAAVACVTDIFRVPAIIRCVCALILAPTMTAVASSNMSLRHIAGSAASLLAASALTEALAGLAPENAPLLPRLFVACIAACLILGRRRHWLGTWETLAEITFGGKRTRFHALIDSGNRLREPVSGLEVMLVSEDQLSALLPDSFDPSQAWRALPSGFRLAVYGGVGGCGEMGCFMPDKLIFITSGKRRDMSGRIWIGVYPGKLPGRAIALAPASVIE